MNSRKHRQNRTPNTHIHGRSLCQLGNGTSIQRDQGEGVNLDSWARTASLREMMLVRWPSLRK